MYSRVIDGQSLSLAPSGWAYKNTFVLYDLETGTLWYPYRKGLKGIQGKHFGKWLKKLPSDDTLWRKWKRKHPDTELLR